MSKLAIIDMTELIPVFAICKGCSVLRQKKTVFQIIPFTEKITY